MDAISFSKVIEYVTVFLAALGGIGVIGMFALATANRSLTYKISWVFGRVMTTILRQKKCEEKYEGRIKTTIQDSCEGILAGLDSDNKP